MFDVNFSFILFHVLVVLALIVDVKLRRSVSLRSALGWSVFWITLALGFAVYVGYARSWPDATTFLAAYILEKSLSLDNVFVFWVIFQRWNIPSIDQHRVLMWGVAGAIVMRALMITLGAQVVRAWHGVLLIFGLFLIATGVYVVATAHKSKTNRAPASFNVDKISSNTQHFWYQGKPTVLLMALMCVEWSDVVFALDSVPAIFGLTQDVFIIYTSNILAILGLRALYEVLQHAAGRMHYLPYGIGFILVVVGLKMLGIIALSPVHAIVLTLAAITASVVASLRRAQDCM